MATVPGAARPAWQSSGTTPHPPLWSAVPSVAVAVVLFGVVLACQYLGGAYASERGLHSDEAAHLLNGLLLRDYLREGLGQDPMAFAQTFYAHYPKIAPFMWPPLLHVLLGVAMLAGWPPGPTALVVLAACTTWIGWRLVAVVTALASRAVAIGAVVLLLGMPAVAELTGTVMIDIVVAAIALEAAWWLARFADTGRMRHAVCFGVTTGLACAAKGNGLSVVLAPLVLLTLGRVDLLRRPGLYVAAAVTAVLAAPWLVLAFWLGEPADFGAATPAMMAGRLQFYLGYLASQLGPLAALAAAVGLVATVTRRARLAREQAALAEALVALVGGALLFHVLNPHVVSAGRYIALALAPLVALAALGVTAAGALFPTAPRTQAALAGSLMLALAAERAVTAPRPGAQPPLGYRAVMTFLDDADALAGRRILIVSNELGEGAGVADAATRSRQPAPTILRGSKLLASDDWMGRNFRLRYEQPEAILAALETMHVDYLLLDGAADARALPYWPQVHTLVTTHGDRFDKVFERPVDAVSGPLRPLTLYRLKFRAPGPPAGIDMAPSPPTLFGN